MATRSIVAYPTKDGFEGYYIHWDGYPSGVGASVYNAFNKLGEEGLKAYLSNHPGGFISFPEIFIDEDHESCYCGNSSEPVWFMLDHNEAVSVGCEYAYVLKGNLLHIYSAYSKAGVKMIGMFGSGDSNAHWNLVAIVDMKKPSPDWSVINRAASESLELA